MKQSSNTNLTSQNTQITELKSLRNHVNACVESDVVEEGVLGQIDQMINEHYLSLHNHRIFYQEKEKTYKTYVDLPEGSEKKYIQVTSSSLEKLQKKLIAHYKAVEMKMTVWGLYKLWLEERMRHNEIEKSTRDRFETDFTKVFIASGFASRYVEEITEDELDCWIRDIISDYHLSRKAWSNVRIILSGIFKYAKKRKMTNISISYFLSDLQLSDHMFKHRVREDWEEVFTDDELSKIVEWIMDPRNPERQNSLSNLGILLCIFTGLRAGEIVALKKSDLSNNMLRVTRTETRYKSEEGGYQYEMRESTKGRDGWRVIAVPEIAVTVIQKIASLNPEAEYLFTNRTSNRRMISSTLSDKLKRICKYLGIPVRTLHKIRKTYASILLDAGVSEKIVTSQMGHTDITTTRGFYYKNRFSEAEKIAAVTNALKYPVSLLGETAKEPVRESKEVS